MIFLYFESFSISFLLRGKKSIDTT
ncbi:hypothetical protein Xen7305DRAFT_00047220, partial [Xenococcus sp. PCC 7305]